jgi:predicted permease
MRRALYLRLLALIRRRRTDEELDEELRFHLARDVERYLAAGMSPEDALAAARRGFGNVTQITESAREAWRWGWLERARQDLRYAARALRRSPVFAVVAVLSLGIGIGANTAMFSVVDGLMLAALPVTQPDRLVSVREISSAMRNPDELTYIEFGRLGLETSIFANVAAMNMFDRSNITLSGSGGGLDAGRARVALVTGSYFPTLGVRAALGRTLSPNDDRAFGAHPVVVISDGYWERRLARAADVLERTLTLNGTTYQIVGVTPPRFTGDWVGRPTDLWIPFAMHQQVLIEQPGPLIKPNDAWLRIVARLAPGVSVARAEAAATLVHRGLLREWAGPNATDEDLRGISRRAMGLVPAGHGYSLQREGWTQSIRILSLVVALVLLIACANVASLLVARGVARQRELAVRLAIGASTARLVRQLLTESLLLSLLGGVLGLAFARWATTALASTISTAPVVMFWGSSSWLDFDIGLNHRALLFTLGTCIVTALLFGLAPALRGSKVGLGHSLAARAPTQGVGRRGERFRLGKALVVAQVALSVVVLLVAALFMQTLRNLRSESLGFARERVLLAWTQPSATGARPPELREVWRRVVERVSQIPGVRAVGASNQGVLTGSMPQPGRNAVAAIRIPGRLPRPTTFGGFRSFVTPGFFAAMGVPLLAGREFTELDTDAKQRVMIINQAMAKHYFGDESPIGQQVMIVNDSTPTEIVGVVGNFVTGTPRGADVPQHLTYFSYRDRESQRRIAIMMLAVRTSGEPRALAPRIRQEIQSAAPSLPVLKMDTVDEQLDDVLAQDRLLAGLGTFFGALALLLACLGLYGVIAFTTTRRTSEIGIRLALGATRGAVLGMVLRESLTLVLVGIALGVPVALAATRLVASRLFGVTPADPTTALVAALLMLAVATIAAFLPARRAAGVEPVVALRCE